MSESLRYQLCPTSGSECSCNQMPPHHQKTKPKMCHYFYVLLISMPTNPCGLDNQVDFFFLDRLVGLQFGHSPISNCNVNCFSGFLCVIWCGGFLEGWKCKCYYVVWKPHFQCLPDNRKGLQFSAFSACWVLAVLFSSFCAVTVCVIPFRIQKEVSMCAWTRFWDLEGNTLKGITGKQDSVYICTWSDMWERWDLCFPTN